MGYKFLLFYIALSVSYASLAQQSTLPKNILMLRMQLSQIHDQKNKIIFLNISKEASTALDSLGRTNIDSCVSKIHTDSTILNTSDIEAALKKLKEREDEIIQQLEKEIQGFDLEALPKEMQEVLNQLKQTQAMPVSNLSKASNSTLLKPSLPISVLPPAPAIVQPLSPNSGALTSLAKQQAVASAQTFFSNNKGKLSQARQDLDKYKARYGKIESLKNMPKGFFKANPLKGKPWPERVLVGTQWQLGKQDQYIVDLGPYAAWRFTDKLSLGAGFQYRLSVSVENKPWVSSSDKVLGYFAFTDLEIKKGFFARLHYEDLNTPVPRINLATQSETVNQEWVKGLSVGVGKSYTFYKWVRGYGLVQYNLLHKHGQTPYLQPFQAKIGFYMLSGHLLRKSKKKANGQ